MSENHSLPFSLANDFQVERILGYDAKQKLIVLLGNVNSVRTIVLMEKTQFPIDSHEIIQDWMSLVGEPSGLGLQQVIGNDKYYMLNLPVRASDDFNLIKSTMYVFG